MRWKPAVLIALLMVVTANRLYAGEFTVVELVNDLRNVDVKNGCDCDCWLTEIS